MNAVGADVEFGGIPRSNALKVLQVELFSVGQIEPEDASYDVVDEEKDGRYVRLVFRDSHLVGAILLGDAEAAPRIEKAIESRMDLSRLLQQRPTAREALECITTDVSAG
jgi:nitrite reductase (NADH) large subunit